MPHYEQDNAIHKTKEQKANTISVYTLLEHTHHVHNISNMTMLYTAPLGLYGRQQHGIGVVDRKFDRQPVSLFNVSPGQHSLLFVHNENQHTRRCQALASTQIPAFDEPSAPPDTPSSIADADWLPRDALPMMEGDYGYGCERGACVYMLFFCIDMISTPSTAPFSTPGGCFPTL